ncbi:hypothetical protein GOBAR_DD06565 [Gossypium barbadense]|nr:hypothetical protein GOBAR_DD06565 [Gossypium barbadense]
MVHTCDCAAQELPSMVNRHRNRFSAPPFVTIDSDESPPSPPPQPRYPKRNQSPTSIVVIYPSYEPPTSDYHPPNSPVEPPNSSDNQDCISPQSNLHVQQPTKLRPSIRTPSPPGNGVEPHSAQHRTRTRQQPPLTGQIGHIECSDEDTSMEQRPPRLSKLN